MKIDGLEIILSEGYAGQDAIKIENADDVTISNNKISMDKEYAEKNGYPINASNTNNLKISNNTITYDAAIQSDYESDRGLKITGTEDNYLAGIEVTDNEFNFNLPLREISWLSGLTSFTPSAGVELSYCKGAVFSSNKVFVTSR